MNKPTRRSFLATCSAAGLAMTLPPRFYLQTSDKSGTRPPVVGSGAHTYEFVHDWLVPPQGLVWGDTHGLCQDEQGNIYVGHTVHKSSMRGEAIVVFDQKARFIRAFGEGFRGGAHGLKLRREGKAEFLYHCDINRCRVVKTKLTGEEIWVHGYPREDSNYGERPIEFVPTNVAFAPNGDFYVGDGYGSSHILRYSLEGKFLGEVGKPGQADGEFQTPHGLWVDPRTETPVLTVADRGNRRIQTFTIDGTHLRTIKDEEHMRMPCNFHTQGEWMVCPDLDSQVCILDREGKVVAQLGDGKAENGDVDLAGASHARSLRRESSSRLMMLFFSTMETFWWRSGCPSGGSRFCAEPRCSSLLQKFAQGVRIRKQVYRPSCRVRICPVRFLSARHRNARASAVLQSPVTRPG